MGVRRGHHRLFQALVASLTALHGLTAQERRQVDDATLLRPPDQEWVTYGRDYAETHHSPLKQIDTGNVARLGLAWSVEVGSEGKVETTPLVCERRALRHVDLERRVRDRRRARGKLKWRWDPALVRGGYGASGARFCCGAGQSRRRALQRQGVRRSARRPSRRARRRDRPCRRGPCRPRRPTATTASRARRAS